VIFDELEPYNCVSGSAKAELEAFLNARKTPLYSCTASPSPPQPPHPSPPSLLTLSIHPTPQDRVGGAPGAPRTVEPLRACGSLFTRNFHLTPSQPNPKFDLCDDMIALCTFRANSAPNSLRRSFPPAPEDVQVKDIICFGRCDQWPSQPSSKAATKSTST